MPVCKSPFGLTNNLLLKFALRAQCGDVSIAHYDRNRDRHSGSHLQRARWFVRHGGIAPDLCRGENRAPSLPLHRNIASQLYFRSRNCGHGRGRLRFEPRSGNRNGAACGRALRARRSGFCAHGPRPSRPGRCAHRCVSDRFSLAHSIRSTNRLALFRAPGCFQLRYLAQPGDPDCDDDASVGYWSSR